MRQPELVTRVRQRLEDPAGRYRRRADRVVESGDVARRCSALPQLHTARVDDLDRVRSGCAQHPGGVVPRARLLAGRNLPEQVLVVAQQCEEPGIDDWRVIELRVRVARGERRYRCFHRGRIAQPGVAIARGERAGDGAPGPRAPGRLTSPVRVVEPRRGHRIRRVLLRLQPAPVVHARSRDVRVDVHAARHHDHAARIQSRCTGWQFGDDLPVFDANVADDAGDSVRGIVHRAARNPQTLRLRHGDASLVARSRTTTAAAGGPATEGRSGRGTSSMRNAIPPSWIPATPVSTATAGLNARPRERTDGRDRSLCQCRGVQTGRGRGHGCGRDPRGGDGVPHGRRSPAAAPFGRRPPSRGGRGARPRHEARVPMTKLQRLRITGGTVYDPANGVAGVVRDVCIEDGKVVAKLPAGAPRLDAGGMIVMPGGVDIHSHIAGSSVNHGRRLQPEEHAADPVPAPRLDDPDGGGEATGRSGTGGTIPSTFATGYRYAGLGYTTAMEAAVAPLSARHAHAELDDTPIIDAGLFALLGNDEYLFRQIAAGEQSRARDYAAWVLRAAGAYAIKIVNPGGVELWKRGAPPRNVTGLDDPVGSSAVTPRRILETLTDAGNELGLPHPVHIHCNSLGQPGNAATTLETMQTLAGRRAHFTHLQFHSYGGGRDTGWRSRAKDVIEYVNAHAEVSVDVGQVMFGPATTVTAKH